MKKKNKIFENLLVSPVSKDEFREIFDLNNIRSVENYITEVNKFIQSQSEKRDHLIELKEPEIIYDRAIKKYRFNTLLPTFIPYKSLMALMKTSIHNTILSDDYQMLIKSSDSEACFDELSLIPTDNLSNLLKKMIQITIAIQINYSLQIEYKKAHTVELKYISPHSLIEADGIHYVYASYHTDNVENIGAKRTFALNGIAKITAHQKCSMKLAETIHGNAWGAFEHDVLLLLKSKAADFYKREGFSVSNTLTFVSEESDGSVIAKIRYAQEQDVINFIQKWMPFVTVAKDTELKERIIENINKNLLGFMTL